MACFMLHIMEDPDRDAYRDPDLKDVVGLMPRCFCALTNPATTLLPSEVVRCVERDAPCWKANVRAAEKKAESWDDPWALDR